MMPPFGEFKRRLLNIGEAPGGTEDTLGKPWQGKAGNRLKRGFAKVDISLFEDCLNTNSINCRPPKNRSPSDFERACCHSKIVHPTVARHSPHTIALFGGSAMSSILGQRWPSNLGPISKWRGYRIPDRELNAWVCPTFHPSYVERERDREEIETVWIEDLRGIVSTLDQPLPTWEDEATQVKILSTDDDVGTVLKRIIRGEEGDLIAFDYETTGLKPHASDHEIVCISVATKPNTYSFMTPRSDEVLKYWGQLLRSKRIGKCAHNMKFETMWSKVILGVDVHSWVWDSMLAAHIVDNRAGITSLKFQAYVEFGVVGYDKLIGPYLKGTDVKDGNSKNRIREFIDKYGEREALIYCGLDSLFCLRLSLRQMKKLGGKRSEQI